LAVIIAIIYSENKCFWEFIMKKNFCLPRIEIISISSADIITTSPVGGGNIELPFDPFCEEEEE